VNTNESDPVRVDRWYDIGRGAHMAGQKWASVESVRDVSFGGGYRPIRWMRFPIFEEGGLGKTRIRWPRVLIWYL